LGFLIVSSTLRTMQAASVAAVSALICIESKFSENMYRNSIQTFISSKTKPIITCAKAQVIHNYEIQAAKVTGPRSVAKHSQSSM
jgi:hypothetical protein